jgi:hypothetical protein
MNNFWTTATKKYTLCLIAFCSIVINAANAQYYYKDIVVTGQISANYRLLRDNKVTRVTITPSALDPTQNTVTLQQTINAKEKLVLTYTKVPDAPESWLKSYYNAAGFLIKTVDSSADVVTTSLYEYDATNRPATISSNSIPVNDPAETEVHKWKYSDNGQPVQMIKIKDGLDTTFVSFVPDEHGDPGEEKYIRHKGGAPESYYYYFDAQHRITDVTRFNKKANRILPDYIFEYNETSQPTQMIVVPEGSTDYQTWKYIYNQQGLKEKDICYSKQKEMVASINYTYAFGR